MVMLLPLRTIIEPLALPLLRLQCLSRPRINFHQIKVQLVNGRMLLVQMMKTILRRMRFLPFQKKNSKNYSKQISIAGLRLSKSFVRNKKIHLIYYQAIMIRAKIKKNIKFKENRKRKKHRYWGKGQVICSKSLRGLN